MMWRELDSIYSFVLYLLNSYSPTNVFLRADNTAAKQNSKVIVNRGLHSSWEDRCYTKFILIKYKI